MKTLIHVFAVFKNILNIKSLTREFDSLICVVLHKVSTARYMRYILET